MNLGHVRKFERAQYRPIPLVAPVTSAVLPFKSCTIASIDDLLGLHETADKQYR